MASSTITGTEPRQANLRDEPYWGALTEVFSWAEENTSTAVLSCLAAHASVLHSDGIGRHRLLDKRFGVFDSTKQSNHHQLTNDLANRIRFPHSRWNEVRAEELTFCGYSVLTQSLEAGVDLFVKRKKKSLFVHFQGHPEYSERTLLKEYRRDIKRFLAGERETYPSMPAGYFDAAATQCLNDFHELAVSGRPEEMSASSRNLSGSRSAEYVAVLCSAGLSELAAVCGDEKNCSSASHFSHGSGRNWPRSCGRCEIALAQEGSHVRHGAA